MAKLSAGLLIFFSCIAIGSGALSAPREMWRSPATLETNWVARGGEALAFRAGRSKAARSGIFSLDSGGITFRSNQGKTLRWPYTEIETFDLTKPDRLTLRTYENKSWRRPGEKDYAFWLAEPVPPTVAAALARHVAKPSRNGFSSPSDIAFASMPARHPTHFGGTNGTLRFTKSGIEYTTPKQGDSRSWRWSDIRTLANPDPYRLRIDGYRETYDFLLKEPLGRDLFDKLWDYVYAKGLNVAVEGGRS
jgi:hypothetical protein